MTDTRKRASSAVTERDRENPVAGPMQERRIWGEAQPERAPPDHRDGETPDRQAIEIDHAKERPQPGD